MTSKKLKILNALREDLPKYQRVRHLMEVLMNLNQRFDCPQQAHRHIADCLKIIEKHFVPSKKSTMDIYDFCHFFLNNNSDIYYSCQFRDHHVLIHRNGSYAIYRSKIQLEQSSDFNWSLYRKRATCLTQIKNSENKSIWENEYQLALTEM